MPRVEMVREQLGNATLIRLRGSFDLPQAIELRAALAQLGDDVILDFSQVDDLRVHALGIVAQSARPGVHLLGLRQHHADVLSYLGFDVDDRGRLLRREAGAGAH
jgi:anti-anti-sigma regulatory factor